MCVLSCACMCVRSQRGSFLPCYGSSFIWRWGRREKKVLSSRTGPPSSGQNKLPKADPSCLPSLPLSGDFNHSAEAALRAKAPFFKLIFLFTQRTVLSVFTTFFGRCYSLWHLMFADFAHHERTKRTPHQCHLPLLSLCFYSVENQELPQMCSPKAITLCFKNTWAVPCFWLCYSIHLTSSLRLSTCRFGDVCFSLMY